MLSIVLLNQQPLQKLNLLFLLVSFSRQYLNLLVIFFDDRLGPVQIGSLLSQLMYQNIHVLRAGLKPLLRLCLHAPSTSPLVRKKGAGMAGAKVLRV